MSGSGEGAAASGPASPTSAIAPVPPGPQSTPAYPKSWVNQMPRGLSFPDDKAPQSQLKGDSNWAVWLAKMCAGWEAAGL